MGLTFRGMLSVGLLVSAVAVPPARQTSKSRRGPLDTGREYCLVGRRPGRGRTTMTTCGLVDAPATGHQASARCVTSLRAADHTSRMPSTVACGRNRQPIEDTISDHMLHAAPFPSLPGFCFVSNLHTATGPGTHSTPIQERDSMRSLCFRAGRLRPRAEQLVRRALRATVPAPRNQPVGHGPGRGGPAHRHLISSSGTEHASMHMHARCLLMILRFVHLCRRELKFSPQLPE